MDLVTTILVITAICSALCVIFTCVALYFLLCGKGDIAETHPIPSNVKFYCISSMLSFCCSSISQIAFLTDFNDELRMNRNSHISANSSNYNEDYYSIYMQINIGLNGVTWAMGEYFLYLLFVKRLYDTYKHSVFKVPKWLCFLIMLCLLIFLCSQTTSVVLGLCTYHPQKTGVDNDTYFEYAEILDHISASIHIIVSLVLLYMFVVRLLKLAIMCGQNTIRNTLLMSSRSNTSLSDDIDIRSQFTVKQMDIMDLAIKQYILSSTAIISSQIFFNFSLVLVSSFHGLRYHPQRYKKDATLVFIMLPIDCVVNILCTLLAFRFKEKWYRILCGLYHKLCSWICTKCVECRLKQEYVRLQHLLSVQQSGSKNATYSKSFDVTRTPLSDWTPQMKPIGE